MLFDIARETRQPVRTWVLHSWSVMLRHSGAEFERHRASSLALAEAHMLALSAPSSTCNLSSLSVAVCVGKIVGVMCERVTKDEKNKDVARKLFAIAYALSKYALPSPEPNRVVVLEWLRCVERLCKFGVVKKDDTSRMLRDILRDDVVELGFRPFSESASWETQRVAIRCLENLIDVNAKLIVELELELECVELFDRTVARGVDMKDLERLLHKIMKVGVTSDSRRLYVWIALFEMCIRSSVRSSKSSKKTSSTGEDEEDEDDEFVPSELCGKNTFSSEEQESRSVSERVWKRCGGSVYASTKCVLLNLFVDLVRLERRDSENDSKILERIVGIVTSAAQSSEEIVQYVVFEYFNHITFFHQCIDFARLTHSRIDPRMHSRISRNLNSLSNTGTCNESDE